MKRKNTSSKKKVAVAPAEKGQATYFEAKDSYRKEAKLAVAECIVKNYLSEGDSILLDAGSSLYPIAEMIARDAESEPERTHFTIMTHNYEAFKILAERGSREGNLNIVLAGGRFDQDLNALFGDQAVSAYEDFFPRVVLLGISGFVAEIGLFCHGNTEELAVKRAMFGKRARDRIIVADYSKIGRVDGFRFGDSQGLRANVERCVVVTDQPPDDSDVVVRECFEKEVQLLRQRGVEVREVPSHDIATSPR